MENKSAFFKGWLKFWTFFAGLLQDQGDRASSKRAIMFSVGAVYLYQCIVYIKVPADQMNMQIFWGNLATLLTFGGFVISEFFRPLTDSGILKNPSK